MTYFTIRRTAVDRYQLEDNNGDVIQRYSQVGMSHPDDWIDDALDHDLDAVSTSNRNAAEHAGTKRVIKRWQVKNWEYIDDR